MLKSIETDDPGPLAVVNEDKYIQHTPQTHEGSQGFAALFQQLSKTSPRVNIVQAFEDGDFALGVSEGNFNGDHCAFYDLLRLVDGKIVEHWDTIEMIAPRQDWKNNNGKF